MLPACRLRRDRTFGRGWELSSQGCAQVATASGSGGIREVKKSAASVVVEGQPAGPAGRQMDLGARAFVGQLLVYRDVVGIEPFGHVHPSSAAQAALSAVGRPTAYFPPVTVAVSSAHVRCEGPCW